MRFTVLVLVILVAFLPEYDAGYLQDLKNLLLRNQDRAHAAAKPTEENPSEAVLSRDLEDLEFNSDDEDGANIQSTGGSMRILFAYYGLSCADSGRPKLDVQCKWTRWARDACYGESSCTSDKVTYYSDLGDPYPRCYKDFLVVAECPDGEIIANYISRPADGRKFHLSCTNTV